MWKEMVSEKQWVFEKISVWKTLMSHKIGQLKTSGIWKGIVPEKHFMSENICVWENLMSENLIILSVWKMMVFDKVKCL